MGAVDPKDMTAGELLRWAANGEDDEHGNHIAVHKLVSALSGMAYEETGFDRDRRNILALADKIDAEIEEARGGDVNDTFMTILDRLITFNSYPSRSEGEGFVGWVERCWLPRPRYEDGEPVQFGDEVKTHNSWQTSLVTSFKFTEDGSYVYYRWAGKNDGASVCGEHVKRPTPEVLLADGLPAKVGETVYRVDTGKGFEIARIAPMCPGDDECKTLVLWGDDNEWRAAIDHTHTPPDSQERIDEDAQKTADAYWGCIDVSCEDCPAKIDGKNPHTRFGTRNCAQAQMLDLLRRQRRLDEVSK